jgi:hypothetical protein|tara:strand:+ start:5525 stop:5722 length:198 start_codon:yes stop_codon:yes gene_type:complete
LLKNIEGFVCSFSAGSGVNPAYFDFVAVIAAYTDTEANATGSHFCKVGELASYGYWVSKGEEIHP